MFKKIAFILLVGLTSPVHSAAQSLRHLIMLLDFKQAEGRVNQHTGSMGDFPPALGAITFTLLPALYQKAAPILVSTSLLKNILNHRKIFFDFVKEDTAILRRTYGPRCAFSYCPNLQALKENCMYTDKMYRSVNETLNKHLKNGTMEDIRTTTRRLHSSSIFAEEGAPPSLHRYSSKGRLPEALHKEMSAYALCAYAPLDSDHWVIKEVSQELTLLIPKEYLTKTSNESPLYKGSSIEPTALEKTLGLKIHHLRDIHDINELTKERPVPQEVVFTRHLSKLFTEHNKQHNRWTVYIAGHGLPAYPERAALRQLRTQKKYYETQRARPHAHLTKNAQIEKRFSAFNKELSKTEYALKGLPPTGYESIICSVPLAEFSTFLTFLQTHIATNLLFYTSCYAGGEHLITPYHSEGKDRIFNYTIITGTASDNAALQEAPMFILPPYSAGVNNERVIIEIPQDAFDLKKRSLCPRTSLKFDAFFAALDAHNKDYHHLISLLHPYTDKDGNLRRDFLANYAHIRKAGSSFFEPVSTGKPFIVLNDAQKKPVTAQDSGAVLLYKNQTPEIILKKGSSKQPPAFLSMIPGPSWHTLPMLTSPDHKFIDLFLSFLDLPDMRTPKAFFIKKVICHADNLPVESSSPAVLTDVLILRNVQIYENVRYQTAASAYFTMAGTSYYVPLTNSPTIQARKVSFENVKKELSLIFKDMVFA